ncbi:MAG: preprotein translocase subunit SecE [Actinobacteria bacterium HGW-Actinobacteria-10]|jgi:preprotein translocase SecE subunit|nr:MAG: preprotein translocase subunit SecE [Actinobacteria bacterium HGW-Actinobacteria-10]
MAKVTGATKPNLFKRILGYFRNVWLELKRVVWPGRTEVYNSSIVVIATLLFFIAFTFLVDSAVIYIIGLVGEIGG